jgi:hypothetical protein
VAVNGNAKGVYELWADNVLEDISGEEVEAFMKLLIRAYKVGRTKAQVRAALQAGLTITL